MYTSPKDTFSMQECNDLALGVYYVELFVYDTLEYFRLLFKAENQQSPEKEIVVEATTDLDHVLEKARKHAEERAMARKQKRSHEYAFFVKDLSQTISNMGASHE